ncbi:hypothetical protein K5D34_04305 [Pseudomonas cichorii]|nr:hypothetical protein [Pseudomonas cichorii]MBX8508915.1 hypothetical protein [Pseudomonas cichorii]MBX8524478.1 hypothetical protein [Pseudomonas cichorii]
MTTHQEKMNAAFFAYEKLILKICEFRPELDPEVIKGCISRLERVTPLDHYACAEEALSLVQAGKPLPWE